jgi:glycogen debranching enzyme
MQRQHLTTVGSHAFIVSNSLGDIEAGAGQGLFVADTRFLSKYALSLDGQEPILLRSGLVSPLETHIYATNPVLDGAPSNTIELVRRRRLGEAFTETITLINRGDNPVQAELALAFDKDFADIFEVRSMVTSVPPRRGIGRTHDRSIVFRDRRQRNGRKARIQFTPEPDEVRRGRARFALDLPLDEPIVVSVRVDWDLPNITTTAPVPITSDERAEPLTQWLRDTPNLLTDDLDLQLAYDRAVRDLAIPELDLSSGHAIPAAGVPWYLAIFGRDALITSLQSLLLGPRMAMGTLRTLAAYQATERNDFRDAEPGKMPHEIRFGELAGTNALPHARYYGSVDATPLWILLFCEVWRWAGDREFIAELLPAAERAMRWIDEEGDLDGDGLIEYQCRSPHGLENQGWKDSWDSVRFADGSLADSPIALVEVQGYVYAAKRALADLYHDLGRSDEAGRLRKQAARLKGLVQQAFWLPSEEFYALALDKEKRPVDSVTSNPGQLLWSGLPDEPYAGKVVTRLMEPESFSGWGLRTMATTMGAYNPMSYHNGSIWPHDNSLIAAGFSRYGYVDEAARVINDLVAVTRRFDDHRLPELFCGYDRAETPFPVDYPVACSPQAWAAGSIVLMVQTLAGIAPGATGIDVQPLPQQRALRLTNIPFRGGREREVAAAIAGD